MKTNSGFGCIGVIALSVGMMFFNGWVLMLLWEWFIAPMFHIMVPSIWTAVGINLIVSFMTKEGSANWNEEWYVVISRMIAWPITALTVGFIISRFIM